MLHSNFIAQNSLLEKTTTMDTPNEFGIPDYEFRVVIGKTRIEYDPNKEEANRKKHGYSLESAVHILERILLPGVNPRAHFVRDVFIENGEVRHEHLCMDDCNKVVVMVTTMRPNETVRIISFRSAHEDERNEFLRCAVDVLGPVLTQQILQRPRA